MEETVSLVMAEKDKQSIDLLSFQGANENLKVQLRDLDKRLKESETKYKEAEKKVIYCEFGEYTTRIVDIFQHTPEYDEEIF